MSILNRLWAYMDRRDYEKKVLFRQIHMPQGVMLSQTIAYSRATQQQRKKTTAQHQQNGLAQSLKERARAAFMTHPAATAEDFERCWPSIRDEIFKRHTLSSLEYDRTLPTFSINDDENHHGSENHHGREEPLMNHERR